MKVTPLKKKFGRHAPGDVFELPSKTARLLIKVGKVEAVADDAPPAAVPAPVAEAALEVHEAEEALDAIAPLDVENTADVPDDGAGEPASAPASAPEPSARRQYRRRDMTAESAGKAAPRKAAKKAVRKPAPKKD